MSLQPQTAGASSRAWQAASLSQTLAWHLRRHGRAWRRLIDRLNPVLARRQTP